MLLKERAGHKKCRNKCDAQPLSYILIPILPQYMWSPGFVQLSGLPPSSRLLANILCLFTPDLRILDGGLPTKVQSVPVLPWPQDNASSVQIRSASGLLGRAKHSVQNFIFLRYSPNAQRCHFRALQIKYRSFYASRTTVWYRKRQLQLGYGWKSEMPVIGDW